MVRRTLFGLWTVALLIACAVLLDHWWTRINQAAALGYASWYERYLAESAGFFDPGQYRQAMWEREREETSRRALAAHQEEQRKERETQANGPQYACFAAQMTIKERLKNPSDARFPSCLDYPGHVTTVSPISWIVHSWVEIPDSSGVYRQRGYEVSVDRDVAGKQYRAVLISLR